MCPKSMTAAGANRAKSTPRHSPPRSWRRWGNYHPLQAKLFIIPISLAAPVLLESATLTDPTLLRRSTTCLISWALSSFDNFTSSNFFPFLSSISSILIQKSRTPQGMLLFDPAFWKKMLTAEKWVNDTLILIPITRNYYSLHNNCESCSQNQ